MNRIEKSSYLLLKIMVEAERAMGGNLGTFFDSRSLEQRSGLETSDINEAVEYLGEEGALRRHSTNLDAPFTFQAVQLTGKGRFLFEEYKSRGFGGVFLANETKPVDRANVLVVHGRNPKARDAMFQFLRAIELKPIEWEKAVQATGKPTPFIAEILDAAFSLAQAVVVLMTPDDLASLRQSLWRDYDPSFEKEATPQARPNVLFEAGMAMSRHEDRTLLVELGRVRPFSDIAGRHVVRLSNASAKRQDLAERLRAAGCPVETGGRDWHTAGDFDAALEGL